MQNKHNPSTLKRAHEEKEYNVNYRIKQFLNTGYIYLQTNVNQCPAWYLCQLEVFSLNFYIIAIYQMLFFIL